MPPSSVPGPDGHPVRVEPIKIRKICSCIFNFSGLRQEIYSLGELFSVPFKRLSECHGFHGGCDVDRPTEVNRARPRWRSLESKDSQSLASCPSSAQVAHMGPCAVGGARPRLNHNMGTVSQSHSLVIFIDWPLYITLTHDIVDDSHDLLRPRRNVCGAVVPGSSSHWLHLNSIL